MRHRALTACLGALLVVWAGLVHAQAAGPSIVLTWQYTQDSVSPATGYAIQRCVQLSTGCTMTDLSGATTIPLTTTSFTDVSISPNIQYCYQAASFNQYGRSKYSSVTCGTIGSPPSTSPQNLQLKLVPATP